MTDVTPEETVKPDIARVMRDDPMGHTRADVKMLIDYLRGVRHTFNAGPKRKAPTKKAKATKVGVKAAGTLDFSSLKLK